jgi:hypothetical protein
MREDNNSVGLYVLDLSTTIMDTDITKLQTQDFSTQW